MTTFRRPLDSPLTADPKRARSRRAQSPARVPGPPAPQGRVAIRSARPAIALPGQGMFGESKGLAPIVMAARKRARLTRGPHLETFPDDA
jgi:hypothetical protein